MERLCRLQYSAAARQQLTPSNQGIGEEGKCLGVSNKEARDGDFFKERRLSKRTLSSWLIDIIKHQAVESSRHETQASQFKQDRRVTFGKVLRLGPGERPPRDCVKQEKARTRSPEARSLLPKAKCINKVGSARHVKLDVAGASRLFRGTRDGAQK